MANYTKPKANKNDNSKTYKIAGLVILVLQYSRRRTPTASRLSWWDRRYSQWLLSALI